MLQWIVAVSVAVGVVLGVSTECRAAHVVVMREGKRTVVTVEADYDGPIDKFEMTIPLGASLHKEDVRAVPREVLERLDHLDAPQLFERREVDPCNPRGDAGAHDASSTADGGGEARATGEWIVSVVGKNVVARVDPTKVTTVKRGGKTVARLSPLRFHFDADDFRVPLHVGSDHDVVLHVLARQRQQAADRPTVLVPTNLELAPSVRDSWSSFYATLFDRTLMASPGAAVVECATLQGAPILKDDLVALGADVLPSATYETDSMDPHLLAALGADAGANKKYVGVRSFVLTRLHFRVNPDAADPSITLRDAQSGVFQARYTIKVPWSGESRCDVPVHGVWIVEPGVPATDLSSAPRESLAGLSLTDIPQIGYTAPHASAAPSASAPNEGEGPKNRGGCGSCGTAVLAALYSRRRKRK